MKHLLTIALLLGTYAGDAQDYFVSQFYNQALFTNPALTGQFRGDYRVGGHYRTQWSAVGDPFKIMSASGDAKFVKKPGSRNFFGMGAYVLQDKAGKAQLRNFRASLTAAYNLSLDRKSSLAAGLSLAFIQRSIVFDGLAWDKQYNGVAYDPSLPTGEFFATDRNSGLDLGAGAVYWRELTREIDLTSGLAIYHYRQVQSFLGTEEDRLYPRPTLYAQAEHETELLDLTYHFRMYKQARAFLTEIGAMGVYRIGTDSRHSSINRSSGIIGGVYYRWQDAASIHAGFEYRRSYQLFMSYDLNISPFRAATGMRGGLEISLIYKDWFVRNSIKIVR